MAFEHKNESTGTRHTDILDADPKQDFSEINPDESRQGQWLYSSNFGPCIAVIATVDDGSFILYHARSRLPDKLNKNSPMEQKFIGYQPAAELIKLSMTAEKGGLSYGIDNFVNLIGAAESAGAKILDIKIFQKTTGNNGDVHTKAVPLLSDALNERLQAKITRTIQINIIPLVSYNAVACDGSKKEIVTSSNTQAFDQEFRKKPENIVIALVKIAGVQLLEAKVKTTDESMRTFEVAAKQETIWHINSVLNDPKLKMPDKIAKLKKDNFREIKSLLGDSACCFPTLFAKKDPVAIFMKELNKICDDYTRPVAAVAPRAKK